MAANDYFVLGEEKPLDGEMLPWPGGVPDMKEKYEEFIRVRIRELDSKIEEGVMSAVKEIGVDVDKDELIKALQYDRDQFRKGYKAGIEAAQMAWHPASEKPKEDGDYLCYVEPGFWEVLSYSHNLKKATRGEINEKRGGFYYLDGEYGCLEIENVAYWMELPMLPGGG